MINYIKNLFLKTIIIASSFCYNLGSSFLLFFGYEQPLAGPVVNEELQNLRAESIALRAENTALEARNIVLETAAEVASRIAREDLRRAQVELQATRQQVARIEAEHAQLTCTLAQRFSEIANFNAELQAEKTAAEVASHIAQEDLRRAQAELQDVIQQASRVPQEVEQWQASHGRAEGLQLYNGEPLLLMRLITVNAAMRRSFGLEKLRLLGNVGMSLYTGLEGFGAVMGSSDNRRRPYNSPHIELLRIGYSSVAGGIDCPLELDADNQTQRVIASASASQPDRRAISTNNKRSFFAADPSQRLALYTVPFCMFAVSFVSDDGPMARNLAELVTPFLGSCLKTLGSFPLQFSKYGIDFEIGRSSITKDFGKDLAVLILFSQKEMLQGLSPFKLNNWRGHYPLALSQSSCSVEAGSLLTSIKTVAEDRAMPAQPIMAEVESQDIHEKDYGTTKHLLSSPVVWIPVAMAAYAFTADNSSRQEIISCVANTATVFARSSWDLYAQMSKENTAPKACQPVLYSVTNKLLQEAARAFVCLSRNSH